MYTPRCRSVPYHGISATIQSTNGVTCDLDKTFKYPTFRIFEPEHQSRAGADPVHTKLCILKTVKRLEIDYRRFQQTLQDNLMARLPSPNTWSTKGYRWASLNSSPYDARAGTPLTAACVAVVRTISVPQVIQQRGTRDHRSNSLVDIRHCFHRYRSEKRAHHGVRAPLIHPTN